MYITPNHEKTRSNSKKKQVKDIYKKKENPFSTQKTKLMSINKKLSNININTNKTLDYLNIHSNEKDKKNIRNLTAEHINKFLNNRPTTNELIKNRLFEDTMIWGVEVITGPPPTPRNCHTSTVVGNNMYMLGGFGEYQTQSSFIELAILDITNKKWGRPLVAGTIPSERYSHSCVASDSTLYMFGGFSVNGNWLNDLYIIDTSIKQKFLHSSNIEKNKTSVDELSMLIWYQPRITGEPPSPRAATTAVSYNKKIYYFGGNNGIMFYNDLYVLDTEQMKWSKPKTFGSTPSPRAGHTATLVKNSRIVIFGGGVTNGYANDIYFLDLYTMCWHCPKIYGTAPCPRAGHTAVSILNDTAILVFGGSYKQKVFGDLHMFDIEDCKWTRPSDAGSLPQARAGHSCVSISNIAYFFGGADGESRVFNDVHYLDTAFILLKKKQNLNKQKDAITNYYMSAEHSATSEIYKEYLNNSKFNHNLLKKFHLKYKLLFDSIIDKLKETEDKYRKEFERSHNTIKEISEMLYANHCLYLKELSSIRTLIDMGKENVEQYLMSNETIGYNKKKTEPSKTKKNNVKKSNNSVNQRKVGVVENYCNLFENKINVSIKNSNGFGNKKKKKSFRKKSNLKN